MLFQASLPPTPQGTSEISAEQLQAIEDECNACIRDAHSINVRVWANAEEASKDPTVRVRAARTQTDVRRGSDETETRTGTEKGHRGEGN